MDQNRTPTDDEIRQIIDLHNQNRNNLYSEIARQFNISRHKVIAIIKCFENGAGTLSIEDENFILEKIKDNLEIPTKEKLTNAVNSHRTSRGINTRVSKTTVFRTVTKLRER